MTQLNEQTLFAERYQLQRLLGRGGFSEVWLAIDKITNLEIAVKVYAPGQGMEEDGMKDFCKELSNVYNLNHTNLLKPQHVDSWQGMPYLVMTYCPQGSCHRMIGAMKEVDLWKLLANVASGLAYLHSQGIIHQDIKPDNILIDTLGNYVITDFGISVQSRSTLRKSMNIASGSGTTAYMGPERFSKDPTPIKASDIWSLGATAYELITGNAPFGEIGGGLQKGGADIPTIKQDISSNLRIVVAKLLSADPWERPTAEQLAKWAANPDAIDINEPSGEQGSARPTVRQPKTGKKQTSVIEQQPTSQPSNIIPKKKNTALIITLSVVFFALGIGGFMYYKHTKDKNIEIGMHIIRDLRSDCDRMTSSLNPGADGFKNLDNAIVALRKLEKFENRFKEENPNFKITTYSEAFAMFYSKLVDINDALEMYLNTTKDGKESIMYRGAQFRHERIGQVIKAIEENSNNSASEIHIDADDYMHE